MNAYVIERGKRKWLSHEKAPFAGATIDWGPGNRHKWNCPNEKDCEKREEIHRFYYTHVKPHQLVKNARSGELMGCSNWDRYKWVCKLGIEVVIKEAER